MTEHPTSHEPRQAAPPAASSATPHRAPNTAAAGPGGLPGRPTPHGPAEVAEMSPAAPRGDDSAHTADNRCEEPGADAGGTPWQGPGDGGKK